MGRKYYGRVSLSDSNRGKKHAAITREKVFIRMLERLSWYKILTVIEVNDIKKILSNKLISSLRHKELREKYEFIRKVLQEETLSFTGWGDEYYQKIKHTLFSNRWYRTEQALL